VLLLLNLAVLAGSKMNVRYSERMKVTEFGEE
jgi:hypothetical protein